MKLGPLSSQHSNYISNRNQQAWKPLNKDERQLKEIQLEVNALLPGLEASYANGSYLDCPLRTTLQQRCKMPLAKFGG